MAKNGIQAGEPLSAAFCLKFREICQCRPKENMEKGRRYEHKAQKPTENGNPPCGERKATGP